MIIISSWEKCLKVLRIGHVDTIGIRHQMLRANRPVEECYFAGDEDEQTFHLGAFQSGRLVSVASFYFEKNDLLGNSNQYRLRGMATLPHCQRRGYSSELLRMGFPIAKQNSCNIVWCNARKKAIGFYEKLGFHKNGREFTIPGIGLHQLMIKKIEKSF